MSPPDAATGTVVALRFEQDTLWALDQTALPWTERELELRSAAEVADAIARLAIRGAPLIGVAAGYGVALELLRDPTAAALERAAGALKRSRPTAANLGWAVDRVAAAATAEGGVSAEAALAQARAIDAGERAASDALAAHGADLLADVRRVMTHCNTGALAAPGRGTALAVVAELVARGRLQRARDRVPATAAGRAADRVRAPAARDRTRADRRLGRGRADRRGDGRRRTRRL